MIIRCDNCSVSLQLDEAKIPNGNFTVRCPRCQNLVRVQPHSGGGKGSSTVNQLKTNAPAPVFGQDNSKFAEKESDFEINKALRSLLGALSKGNQDLEIKDELQEKPRRVLLCLGDSKRDRVAKLLVDAGYKVYIAQTPAQANERLREGKTEILIFTPDFAAEFGGAAIIQQKVNAMPASLRRRLFLVSVEDSGNTMNAHEAFLRNLNLIVHANDLDQLGLIMDRALRDFNELYRFYNSAVGVASI
jgi:predicted Zn finger-like uncharacterized protein